MSVVFQAFCNNRRYPKYDFGRPFVQNKWLYGTNGVLLIRTPKDEPDTEAIRVPNIASYFYLFWKDTEDGWVAVPNCKHLVSEAKVGVARIEIEYMLLIDTIPGVELRPFVKKNGHTYCLIRSHQEGIQGIVSGMEVERNER